MADLPLQPRAVSADRVRPLRRQVLRPNQPDDALVYAGDDDSETLHAAVVLDAVSASRSRRSGRTI